MITHFALGEDFMMSAQQAGAAIEVNWGECTTPYAEVRVDVTLSGEPFAEAVVEDTGLEWARAGRGSGQVRFRPPFG